MTVNPAAPLPEDDQPDMTALLLAAAVHLLLIAALFFSVQWRSQKPTAMSVEVWRSAPAPAPAFRPEPLPAPPLPKVEPKPEPRPEPKPEPKPLPKVEPAPIKPDIAIKDDKKKKDEPKKPKEEPKKPELKPEAPKKEPPKKVEAKKEDVKKTELPPRQNFDDALANELKQVQRHKQSHEQRANAEAELGRMIGDREAAALKRGRDDYAAKIRGKIKGNVVLPRAVQGNPEAIFKVTQLPTGEVIDVKISKSSGNKALDEAIERAIRKSDPLPLPDQPGLFERVLELKYKPYDE